MALINDEFIDRFISNMGTADHPYAYDWYKGKRLDRIAFVTIQTVNNFLKTYQQLSGRTIKSIEELRQLMDAGSNLWNTETFSGSIVRVRDQRKEEEEHGLKRDKPLPFFGVDLTNSDNIEPFLTALRPLYIDLGKRTEGDTVFNSGEIREIWNLKVPTFDDFEIRGNELATNEAYSDRRDSACRRFATDDGMKQRVKIALTFLTPFRELEKTISNPEVIRTKSYINQIGLPYPLALVQITAERKELVINSEYVEGVSLYPKPQKPAHISSYSPFSRK